MEKIILIGCGGHARSIIDIISTKDDFKIIGLIGLNHEIGKNLFGYKIIGSDKDLKQIRNKCKNVFVSIGQIGEDKKRIKTIEKIYNFDFKYPNLISKYSLISEFSNLGKGISIGHGSIVNAGVSIDDHCIINTKALIEHDSKIGKYCHISTGVLINGGVKIGEGSFIGSGAIIREGITIPSYTVIGAGKVIMGWPVKEN